MAEKSLGESHSNSNLLIFHAQGYKSGIQIEAAHIFDFSRPKCGFLPAFSPPPSTLLPAPHHPAAVASPVVWTTVFKKKFWFPSKTGQTLGMSRSTDPNKVGKSMPKGTGDQVIIETDEDCPWIFDAKWRGRRVGYARCILENDRLLIGDVLVKNSQCVPWPYLDKLRCLLNIGCPRRNFRGHGIGSKLIDAVILQAQRSGVFEIWGSVTADDIKTTEYLLSVYRSRGFTIRDRDGECLEMATKKIVLTLEPKNLNAVQSYRWVKLVD